MNRQQIRGNQLRQRGVTALFIVIFASILLSIITISFSAMMLREQQRSTDDEQSQGAYDAALAGIEDGKRVIVACRNGVQRACDAINKQPAACTTVIDAGINGNPSHPEEVMVQSSTAGDGSWLNQAYTCVVINKNPSDYIGQLAQHDTSIMVPIKSVSNFSRIKLSWHTNEDASTSSPVSDNPHLPPLGVWQANRPALLRVQLMQYSNGSIPTVDFDSAMNARTIYLYPETVTTNALFDIDQRRVGEMKSQPVRCVNGGFSITDGYACDVTLELPAPAMANREGFLRLTSLYTGTHFRVQLLDAAGPVKFDDTAQTIVDATGRANDLFRRVEARVEMVGNFPYPRATVDITNNFCKTFAVANDADGYVPGSCDSTKSGD